MGKDGLPDAEFKLMQQVRNDESMKVEPMLKQPF
jgi:hypothetical protein